MSFLKGTVTVKIGVVKKKSATLAIPAELCASVIGLGLCL